VGAALYYYMPGRTGSKRFVDKRNLTRCQFSKIDIRLNARLYNVLILSSLLLILPIIIINVEECTHCRFVMESRRSLRAINRTHKAGAEWFCGNRRKPPLTDKRVRQAQTKRVCG